MTTESLNELVDSMPTTIGHEQLAQAWRELAGSLGLDPNRGMEMIIAIPRDLTLRQNQVTDSAWGGAWEWNLSDGVSKAAVTSVLVAAALMAVGAGAGMAPVLIPTVIPFLFDVRRIRLERTAENYLRVIGARNDVAERRGTAASLYDSLPTELKSAVSKADFEEFLAVEAGHAKATNCSFEVLPNGESAFRFAIR